MDWLARKERGVIDFRLPGDAQDIPSHVLRARIVEYLQHVRPVAEHRSHPLQLSHPTASGDLFAEYESVTHD